ncbi:MAG: hypothetical protein ACOX7P_10350, partial [Oscillospiraceae bacterium]
ASAPSLNFNPRSPCGERLQKYTIIYIKIQLSAQYFEYFSILENFDIKMLWVKNTFSGANIPGFS